jgi:hypothetical protein
MTVTIAYTEKDFQRAILHYIGRTYLKRLLLPSIVAVVLVLVAFQLGPDWLDAVAVMLVVVIPAMLALGYWMRIRESLRRFRLLDHGRVTLTLSEMGVVAESANGKSETRWKIYDRLWEFSTEYLLFYHGEQFITLPKDQVPPEFIAFIRAHLG